MEEDSEDLKARILSMIESAKTAISEDELGMRMSNIEKSARIQALNTLIGENKIKAAVNRNKIFYELLAEEQSPEDRVLMAIKESEKNGIWIRDIRFKTKLSQIVLNKALKSLENKKLIRPVKAISNRKLYVLFDLQPDESITGGACYESGVIREDIVKNLKSICFQYFYDLHKNSYEETMAAINSEEPMESLDPDRVYATAPMVFTVLKEKKMFQDIKMPDIENILNILAYECKLKKKTVEEKTFFRYNPLNRDKLGLFHAPCMICPWYQNCQPSSANISPENCQYIHYEKL